tara:strand:+ start:843 stop:1115 length:273 start_codon:yes stop_codon:yes gene_type:complete
MPQGKGTYGSQVGRPPKRKNSTDNYEQTERGKGQNSTDNMMDGPLDRNLSADSTLGNAILKQQTERRAAEKRKDLRKKMKGKRYAKPLSK